MCTIEMTIHEDGSIGAIHNDALAPLYDEGETEISRASHVEPIKTVAGDIMWQADMSPVGGPKLEPRRLRSDALAAEVAWLKQNGW
ncbi:MAG: hypothetical protein WC919_05285 [Candidatus Paceibacterota bacterium]|jgi:hypothetical protein